MTMEDGLNELIPQLRRLAIVYNAGNDQTAPEMSETETAAKAAKLDRGEHVSAGNDNGIGRGDDCLLRFSAKVTDMSPMFMCSASRLWDKPLPLDDKPEQQGIRNDRAVAVATILLTAATATGIAILSTVNPVTLFAATTTLADKSPPQPSTDLTPLIQSVVIQSTADAAALPLPVRDVPTCEIKAPEPASRIQEADEVSSEALFRQFQAWNAEQDARDLAKPLQIHPAPVAKNASASVRPMQKHQRAETKPNAKQTQSLSFFKKLLPSP